MAATEYRTTPLKTDRMPPGILYIVGNEAAERFSYYGMNSILVVFMTRYLLDRQGHASPMTETQADAWYHAFVSCAYFLPVLGAFLADAVLGKYRTVLILSIVYCFGHFALALNDTRLGLAVGLGLIALGAGGIKPCVSANVGRPVRRGQPASAAAGVQLVLLLDQPRLGLFHPAHSRSCSTASGPRLAFGTPGIFMVVATLVFWLGRKKFVHLPPAGVRTYRRAPAPARKPGAPWGTC